MSSVEAYVGPEAIKTLADVLHSIHCNRGSCMYSWEQWGNLPVASEKGRYYNQAVNLIAHVSAVEDITPESVDLIALANTLTVAFDKPPISENQMESLAGFDDEPEERPITVRRILREDTCVWATDNENAIAYAKELGPDEWECYDAQYFVDE